MNVLQAAMDDESGALPEDWSRQEWDEIKSRIFLSGPQDNDESFQLESGVSSSTREGFVVLRWGPMSGQMDALQCRRQALVFLAVAEAAVQDAALLKFMTEHIGIDEDKVGHLIGDLRSARADMQETADKVEF